MTTTVDFKELSEREAISRAKSCPNNLLEDKDFVPGPSSLFVHPSRPSHPLSDVAAWKRPSEIASKPQLFIDGVSAADVCQGALGDCWFVGALAVLATRWDLLKLLIVSAHPELGFYQIRFWKEERWIVVTVDDRLPCAASGKLLYAHCKNENEFWVPLIEKAYAKLHGSYEALDGGSLAYAFVDLSGGASEKIDFPALVSQGKLWQRLQWYLEEAWLIGNSLSVDGQVEGDNGKGILLKHAYSLLGATEVSGTKLVHLRNPWGKVEWRGAWADNDRRWTPALQKKLNHTLGNDGDFWMALEDYQTNFNKMFLCRLYNDSIGAVWKRDQFKLEWKGKTAGGCMNNATWVNNPQFSLKPSKDTPIFISLMQNDTRLNGLPSTDIGIYLMETNDASVPKREPSNIIAASGTFCDDREVTLSAELLKGHQYIGIGCTFNPGFESKFIITVYSKYPCQVFTVTDNGATLEKETPFDSSMKSTPGAVLSPGHPFFSKKKDYSKRDKKPPKRYRYKATGGVPPDQLGPQPASNAPVRPTSVPQSGQSGNAGGGGAQQPRTVTRTVTTTTTTITIPSKNFVVQRPESVPNQDTIKSAKIGNDSYKGQIKDGTKHGVGRYTFASGDVYTGTFVNDEQQGQGEYIFASGDKYVGDMHDSKFHGYGVYNYATGDIYEGEFKDGHRHGVGVFKHKDGTIFKGHYEKGVKEGYGTALYTDGNRYEGNFKNGNPNGDGALYYQDGSVYRGKFKDDLFEDDSAIFDGSNGDTYTGGYSKGKRSGKGMLKGAKGFTYTGEFKDGNMHGKGDYRYSNGDRYVGEFKNGVFNGKGIYYTAAGDKVEGTFKDGKPVEK